MGLGIPPFEFKIMFESSPLKSTMLVRRLAVCLRPGRAWARTVTYMMCCAAWKTSGDRAGHNAQAARGNRLANTPLHRTFLKGGGLQCWLARTHILKRHQRQRTHTHSLTHWPGAEERSGRGAVCIVEAVSSLRRP